MAIFTSGIPRLFIILTALAVFYSVSPETLSRGPDLCLWRNLLNISSCPGCGSTRALAALFHGRLGAAWAFNPNVAVTAPCLLVMLALDIRHALGRLRTAPGSILHSSSNRRPL